MEFRIREDQWFSEYFIIRDGKLFSYYEDRKDQCSEEKEMDIRSFILQHKNNSEKPYPDIVAELVRITGDR